VNFGKDVTVSALKYSPRTDSTACALKKGNIYGSTDGTTFIKIAEIPEIPESDRRLEQIFSWGNKKLKGIALEITECYGNYASVGELELLSGTEVNKKYAVTKSGVLGVGEYGKGAKEFKYLRDWTIEVSSDIGGTKGRLFDGNDKRECIAVFSLG
jgi:hypothetical protein